MTVFKRGDTYWTEFVYKGQRVRQSTGTDNKKKALEFEDKLRRELHEQVMLGRTKAMTFGEATAGAALQHVRPANQSSL